MPENPYQPPKEMGNPSEPLHSLSEKIWFGLAMLVLVTGAGSLLASVCQWLGRHD
jgi:hypothetical protein